MADDVKFRVLASVVGAQAIDNLKKSIDSTARSASDVNSRFTGAASAVKTFAAAFVASAAVQYVKSIINLGDELEALSEKTGIASNQLFGFKVAASTANLSIEGLSGGLNKFSRNLGSIATGNQEVTAALSALGVSAKDSDGKLRGTGDVIIDLADKFAKLKDGPEKARLAVALFGKSGADLIPFLNQGSEALREFSSAFDADFAKRADGFNDSLAILGTKFQILAINAADALLPTLQEISSAFIQLPTDGKEAVGAFDLIAEAVRLLAIGVQGVSALVIDTFDLIQANARGLAAQLELIFTGMANTTTGIFKQAVALAKLDLQEVKRLQAETDAANLEAVRKKDAKIEQLESGLVARQKARAESTKKFYESLAKNSLLLGEGSIDEIKKRQREDTKPGQTNKTGTAPDLSGLNEGSKREAEILAKFKAVQAEQIEAEKLKLEAYKMSRSEFEKLTEAKKIDIEATKATVGMSAEGRAAYLAAAEAVKEQRLALIDLEQQQRETWSVGAIGALNEYVDGVRDVASQTKKLFSDAFKGMEDSLISFVKTGKLNFTDLANSIIEDLIRIAIRKGITGPIADGLSSAFGGGGGAGFSFAGATTGFANGGIMTARGEIPLNKYAMGGVARSPQVAIFGEGRTPEAYVPLPDGRSIPVSMKGGAGGDVFNISVTVQDGGQPQAMGNSPKGGELGKVIANIVQAEIINQKRAGGLLA